ncbi:MAG: hypothetical protein KDC35_01320 [Acidobacteria bacterium]|nr:hypothetical protein [Acidobacteriota bacterium]
MLEWLGIGALYAVALGGMTWWVLRRGRSKSTNETQVWEPGERRAVMLSRAFDQAKSTLSQRDGDLARDWLLKARQAFEEGQRLLERAKELHRATDIQSESERVQDRVNLNRKQRDELLASMDQVVEALELVAVNAPRYFQMDGRPEHQATDALVSAVEAAHRLERKWREQPSSDDALETMHPDRT